MPLETLLALNYNSFILTVGIIGVDIGIIVVHIANFDVDLCSGSVEYCSISNGNSLYQCSCERCCAIAVYTMCYSVINPCVYWTSGTLSALTSNGNTLYNVKGPEKVYITS